MFIRNGEPRNFDLSFLYHSNYVFKKRTSLVSLLGWSRWVRDYRLWKHFEHSSDFTVLVNASLFKGELIINYKTLV
jgi:hypothetical protein